MNTLATIRDIAERAGVSPATVSRILNHDTSLSTSVETKQRVIQVAKELNYIKKTRLSSAPSRYTIGILQWMSVEQELEDRYYLLIRQGIEDYCAKHKINVVRTFLTDHNFLQQFNNIDGIISIGKFSKDDINTLKSITDNLVLVDMTTDDTSITTITLDFEQSVNDVMNYLYNLGHRKIGFLGGKEYLRDNTCYPDVRIECFKKFCAEKNLDCSDYIMEDKFLLSSGYEMMKVLIEKDKVPTAIFAASDPIAIGAMRALSEYNYRIPEDISIVGFDDTSFTKYSNPPLSTVNTPVYAIGVYSVRFVYSMIKSNFNSPLRVKMPCTLIERGSCKPIK